MTFVITTFGITIFGIMTFSSSPRITIRKCDPEIKSTQHYNKKL
jgi:hypothetical protein